MHSYHDLRLASLHPRLECIEFVVLFCYFPLSHLLALTSTTESFLLTWVYKDYISTQTRKEDSMLTCSGG